MGVALVEIGTLDGPEPRRVRTFLFAGLSGSAAGLNGQVGVDKEATSTESLALALGDPDEWFADSDFDSDLIPWTWPPKLPDPAELEIKGDSNLEVLTRRRHERSSSTCRPATTAATGRSTAGSAA